MISYLVTRHQGARQWAEEEGIEVVVEHIGADHWDGIVFMVSRQDG